MAASERRAVVERALACSVGAADPGSRPTHGVDLQSGRVSSLPERRVNRLHGDLHPARVRHLAPAEQWERPRKVEGALGRAVVQAGTA